MKMLSPTPAHSAQVLERINALKLLWQLYRRLPVNARRRGFELREENLRPVRKEIRRQIGIVRRFIRDGIGKAEDHA